VGAEGLEPPTSAFVAGFEAYGGAVGSEGAWPLIGRDEEMALLAAEPTEAPSLVVAGPVGVGKSRLVADFLARARAEGVAAVLVRATRSTATIPFGPFAPWAPDGQGVAAADRLGVLRALSTSLVGGHEQLVVAVDDAHLLYDGPAALVLHLTANTPARVVVTVRTVVVSPGGEATAGRPDQPSPRRGEQRRHRTDALRARRRGAAQPAQRRSSRGQSLARGQRSGSQQVPPRLQRRSTRLAC
jgi:AAA ATPase domain